MNLKDTVKSTVIRSNHVIKLIASKQNVLNVKQNELSSDVKNNNNNLLNILLRIFQGT